MHTIFSHKPQRLALLLAAALLGSTAVMAAPGGQDRHENAGPGTHQQSQHNNPHNSPQPLHEPGRQQQSAPARAPAQPQMRPGNKVAQLPSGYRQIHHRESDYYYARGAWYRPQGAGFIIVMPPIGLSIPVLPGGYITVIIGGRPYYRYNDIYYVQRGTSYVVVDAPSEDQAGTASQDELYIYPANNQSAAQQSKDRYECHQWGNSQTGYDPTQAYGGVAASETATARANYQRAMTACLEARGYTVR